MANQFTYGYLKEAVKAHLDLEEDELEVMNISQRFHIFANEAIQQINYRKPKTVYFEFTALSTFTPLVYDDGVLRVATLEEQNWQSHGIAEPTFASEESMVNWYNEQGQYLVGQVINMPEDFLSFAVKKSFIWNNSIIGKVVATKDHITHLSSNELIVHYAANYQIPYNSNWFVFSQADAEDATIPMPSDLLLTIPIYVASVCLQQRNMNMAQAKRQEFELAVGRCRAINFLENKSVTPTFK